MMKRNLILFAAIAFLCVAGSAYAAVHVKCNADRITISENTISGNVSGAEGLVICFDSCLSDRDATKVEMLPDRYASKNVITFTASGPKNEYSHVPADDAYFAELDGRYFDDLEIRSMDNYDGQFLGIRDWLGSAVYYENVIFQSDDFQKRWKEAGQPGKIRISDFYEYYPMAFEDITARYKEGGGSSWYSYSKIVEGRWWGEAVPISAEEASKALKTFSDFLKIPVLPDDTWRFVSDQNSSYWTPVGNSQYCMKLYKVWTDNEFWFTFDARAEDGSIVDTSEIPGGFGIYRIPKYKVEQNGITAERYDVDKTELFCPLDTKLRIIRLGLSGNGENLFLIYCADGIVRARVIDAETGETEADIPLGNENVFENPGSTYYTFNGEDYYVFEVVRSNEEAGNSEIFVIGKKSGVWCIRMHTTGYAARMWKDGTVAYDGERLAMVAYSDRNLDIIVYSEDGVLYQGTIATSLFLKNDTTDWGFIEGVKCQWK